MPSAYANTGSKYYTQLVYLVTKYGYEKNFTSADANIDGRVLSAMYGRGLFDKELPLGGKSHVIKVYTIKKLIFGQVCIQESKKLEREC